MGALLPGARLRASGAPAFWQNELPLKKHGNSSASGHPQRRPRKSTGRRPVTAADSPAPCRRWMLLRRCRAANSPMSRSAAAVPRHINPMSILKFALPAFLLLAAQSAAAQTVQPPCPGNPEALSTSRVIRVDAATTPRIGRKHFPNLAPHRQGGRAYVRRRPAAWHDIRGAQRAAAGMRTRHLLFGRPKRGGPSGTGKARAGRRPHRGAPQFSASAARSLESGRRRGGNRPRLCGGRRRPLRPCDHTATNAVLPLSGLCLDAAPAEPSCSAKYRGLRRRPVGQRLAGDVARPRAPPDARTDRSRPWRNRPVSRYEAANGRDVARFLAFPKGRGL